MARIQYIFIDYENVCVTDLSLLAGKEAFIFLILGHHQDKLPVKVTLFAQQHPERLRIIQTQVVGRNALDFVLTFELGRQLAADPDGFFHIISKDTGFESVILHLTAEERRIARHPSLAEIPIFRAPRSPADRLTHLIQQLRDGTSGNRPRSRAKLENLIRSAFGSQTEPEFVAKTIDRLLRKKILSINSTGKIEYTHAA